MFHDERTVLSIFHDVYGVVEAQHVGYRLDEVDAETFVPVVPDQCVGRLPEHCVRRSLPKERQRTMMIASNSTHHHHDELGANLLTIIF